MWKKKTTSLPEVYTDILLMYWLYDLKKEKKKRRHSLWYLFVNGETTQFSNKVVSAHPSAARSSSFDHLVLLSPSDGAKQGFGFFFLLFFSVVFTAAECRAGQTILTGGATMASKNLKNTQFSVNWKWTKEKLQQNVGPWSPTVLSSSYFTTT